MASLGSEVRAILHAVQARLNGHPSTATEWRITARQLRTASDKARKISHLAARMEAPPELGQSDESIDTEVRTAYEQMGND